MREMRGTTLFSHELGYGIGHYYDEAEIRRAIERDNKRKNQLHTSGNEKFDIGSFTEAITDYTDAIKVDKNFAQVFCSRGNAYAALGQYAKAFADYKKAILLMPEYAHAKTCLVHFLQNETTDLNTIRKTEILNLIMDKLSNRYQLLLLKQCRNEKTPLGKRMQCASNLLFQDKEILNTQKRIVERLKKLECTSIFDTTDEDTDMKVFLVNPNMKQTNDTFDGKEDGKHTIIAMYNNL